MANHKPPTNGFDKRREQINRKGRPKSFDALRALAQQIAHEVAQSNGHPVVIDGHKATVAEMIMRQWASSKDPRKQEAFIQYAFGKVPDRQELTGAEGGAIIVSELSPGLVEKLKHG